MPGAEHLRDSVALQTLLKRQRDSKQLYAAICAAPAVALLPHGFLDGVEKVTSHPNFHAKLPPNALSTDRVVMSGNIVTSQAPGTALEFSLALVASLYGAAKADEVAKPMAVANWKV